MTASARPHINPITKNWLASHGYDERATLNESQARELFVKLLDEYFGKKIPLKTLGAVSTNLLFGYIRADHVIITDPDFEYMLELADELDWLFSQNKQGDVELKLETYWKQMTAKSS